MAISGKNNCMRARWFGRPIAVILVLLLCTTGAAAQKVLQIETVNKARTIKLRQGDALVFRLQGEDSWERAVISGLDVEKQSVTFGLLPTPITQIEAIKMQKNPFLRVFGVNLVVFGVSWAGYSAIGEFIYHDDINWTTAAVIAATTVPAGLWLNKPRKVRMGERHRLRILDITYPGTEGAAQQP